MFRFIFSSCHVIARNFHGEVKSEFQIVERDEESPTHSQSTETSSAMPQINVGKKREKVTDWLKYFKRQLAVFLTSFSMLNMKSGEAF